MQFFSRRDVEDAGFLQLAQAYKLDPETKKVSKRTYRLMVWIRGRKKGGESSRGEKKTTAMGNDTGKHEFVFASLCWVELISDS
jgi:hypothetical protein